MTYLKLLYEAFARWFLPLPAHDDSFADGAEELSAITPAATETPVAAMAAPPASPSAADNAGAAMDDLIDPDDPSITASQRTEPVEPSLEPRDESPLDYTEDRDNPAHRPPGAEPESQEPVKARTEGENPSPVSFDHYVKPPEAAEERASRSPFRSEAAPE